MLYLKWITDQHKNGFNLLLFLCFSIISTVVFGQNGTITGRIIDAENQENLIGAVVTLDGTSYGTVTDIDGNFELINIPEGTYHIHCTYFSFKPYISDKIDVRSNIKTKIDIHLEPENISLNEVSIVAKVNREAENILLLEQKKSLIAIQNIGANELSRKGIGDAEAAVSKISGISKQEGVKNVFIRGLEDRYNVTLLNGMPVPSEDPEYKNIALEIFGSDIIQNISVNKIFSAQNTSDVAGAIIDIQSKEITDDYTFGIAFSAGLNTQTIHSNFLTPSGSNNWGFTKSHYPAANSFSFSNSLDPVSIKSPVNTNYKLHGGKRFNLGANALSIFAVATHNTEFSYTKETIRNTNTAGIIYQDQTGNKYSGKISQLALTNLKYDIGNAHFLAYNFMMFHTNNQYIGEYLGLQTEKHQDSENGIGFLRRQQLNDNLLIAQQFLSKWTLGKQLKLVANYSLNSINGLEPDRRENYLSQKNDGTFGFTGSNRQKRFFADLNSRDYTTKVFLDYKIGNDDLSKISIGYNGHLATNDFNAVEYNYSAVSGAYALQQLELDKVYNTNSYAEGRFSMTEGSPNEYNVTKSIHAAFVESNYQITKSLIGNVGLRFDYVHLKVLYDVSGRTGKSNIKKPYYLPSLHLKYNINEKNAMRLSASKTYTLPQSKEISPYQYVSLSFSSEGNPNLKPSDNYNLDLKWDYYLSPSELLSAGVFYKHIKHPIGRVDKGNSAGLLTYDNISNFADLLGVEIEIRKNLYAKENHSGTNSKKLSMGMNVSYIHTFLNLKLTNTPERKSGLEGASPFILNSDLTYTYTQNEKSFISSFVFNFFSDRIYTIGALGFNDIKEKGIPSLDLATAYKFNSKWTLKFKASNLFNPTFIKFRESSTSNESIQLNEFSKGVNVSLGVSFDL